MRTSLKSITALTTAAVLGITGLAAAAPAGPTLVTVEPAASLTAGQTSPFDVGGVKAIRRGKAIPKGYVLIGKKVTIKRGEVAAGAALFYKCPGTKRLKSFATTGNVGFGSIQEYVNHRQTYVTSFRNVDATGVVYGVCR